MNTNKKETGGGWVVKKEAGRDEKQVSFFTGPYKNVKMCCNIIYKILLLRKILGRPMLGSAPKQ